MNLEEVRAAVESMTEKKLTAAEMSSLNDEMEGAIRDARLAVIYERLVEMRERFYQTFGRYPKGVLPVPVRCDEF